MSYHTHEHKLLAILEGLQKWEDKLISRHFRVLTDHNSLKWLKSQPELSRRQVQWLEYLVRFDFEIEYIPGSLNAVTHALSRRYESDGKDEIRGDHEYVLADARLDPEGEDSPRILAMAGQIRKPSAKIRELQEREELRAKESREISREKPSADGVHQIIPLSTEKSGNEPLVRKDFAPIAESEDIITAIKAALSTDNFFSRICADVSAHSDFEWKNDLLYYRPWNACCIPEALLKRRRVAEVIIDLGHTALGHMGPKKTVAYIRRWYWWPTMAKEIIEFCHTCSNCQMMKTSSQLPQGLLHTLPIPSRPWGSIAMDFMGPFPKQGNYDYLLVVIGRLTLMVHLIPTQVKVTAIEVASIMTRKVIFLHGLPNTIVLDCHSKFTATMWQELHRILGVKLLMSMAFHPQTDGATERANRTIAQIIRALIESDQLNWAEVLPATELAINSSISSSMGFAPFELNYGWIPRLIHYPTVDTTFKGVWILAQQAAENIDHAFDAIIASRVYMRGQANKKRRLDDPALEVGSKAYLSTKNFLLPKGRMGKLLPKYIGPYTIIGRNKSASTYTLELPEELKKQQIHSVFHANLLRPHYPNNNQLFPARDASHYYDFGEDPNVEYVVDEIVNHKYEGKALSFHVRWTKGDLTWEPLRNCSDLEALDRYLKLQGVTKPKDLPK